MGKLATLKGIVREKLQICLQKIVIYKKNLE